MAKPPRTPIKPRLWVASDGGVDAATEALEIAESVESTAEERLQAHQKTWKVVADQGQRRALYERALRLDLTSATKYLKEAHQRTQELLARRTPDIGSSRRRSQVVSRDAARRLEAFLSSLAIAEPEGKTDRIRRRCEQALRAQCIVYGSRRSGLATTESDVDVCAILDDRRLKEKEHALDRFSACSSREAEAETAADQNNNDDDELEKLCAGLDKERKRVTYTTKARLEKAGFVEVFAVARARVPVVKAVDPETGLQVDVVVNNTTAVQNSNFIKHVVSLDPTFRSLVLLVKFWAKAREVSDANRGTLSSYAHSILAINTLLREGRILISKKGSLPEETDDPFGGLRVTLQHQREEGETSLFALLESHFGWLAKDLDTLGETASLNRGALGKFDKSEWNAAPGRRRDPVGWRFSLEDPLEAVDSGRPRDLGDVLTPPGDERLRAEFIRADHLLQEAAKSDDVGLLKDLFEKIRSNDDQPDDSETTTTTTTTLQQQQQQREPPPGFERKKKMEGPARRLDFDNNTDTTPETAAIETTPVAVPVAVPVHDGYADAFPALPGPAQPAKPKQHDNKGGRGGGRGRHHGGRRGRGGRGRGRGRGGGASDNNNNNNNNPAPRKVYVPA